MNWRPFEQFLVLCLNNENFDAERMLREEPSLLDQVNEHRPDAMNEAATLGRDQCDSPDDRVRFQRARQFVRLAVAPCCTQRAY